MEDSMYSMQEKYHHRPRRGKGLVFGILVITAGVLLMAKNMGALEPSISRVIFSWEMLLVAIGILNLAGRHSIWLGLTLISVGVFFILVNYYHLPFTLWHVFWPLLIIIIGLSMIFGAMRFRNHRFFQNTSGSDDFIEDIAIFGGAERKNLSQSFKGGRIIAVFGGSKIDFSQAKLGEGENMIEVVAVFGGTSLIVPADWNIRVEVFNIFGGYADKRNTVQVDLNKTLVIKGVTIFGGGEIRNF
jgi:predicted membrane protein